MTLLYNLTILVQTIELPLSPLGYRYLVPLNLWHSFYNKRPQFFSTELYQKNCKKKINFIVNIKML